MACASGVLKTAFPASPVGVTPRSRRPHARARVPPWQVLVLLKGDSKLAFYKEGYHLLMRDKAGPAVTADVVAWISDHEAQLPSGADASKSQPEISSLW